MVPATIGQDKPEKVLAALSTSPGLLALGTELFYRASVALDPEGLLREVLPRALDALSARSVAVAACESGEWRVVAMGGATPMKHNAYKVTQVGEMVTRALRIAAKLGPA